MFWFINVIEILFEIYTIMLFVRILSSWIPQAYEYKVIRFIAFCTDPYLNVFRQLIPPLGMFDLSPIVAFLALSFIKSLLIQLIAVLI